LASPGSQFVGRQPLLAKLAALWEAVPEQGTRVAFISGESGIGKSAIAADFARSVHSQGSIVLRGCCDESPALPYQPFAEALQFLIDHLPPNSFGRLTGESAELARLHPTLGAFANRPALSNFDPETDRVRLFHAVVRWLAAISEQSPVLFVIDDLQWASEPTLLLLRHVASNPALSRLLIVGTYRSTEIDRWHSLSKLITDLRHRGNLQDLELDGLEHDEVLDLITRASRQQQVESSTLGESQIDLAEFSQRLRNQTRGNPFFLLQLLEHATDADRRFAAGRELVSWPAGPVPSTIGDVIAERLARLPRSVNDVLTAASVVGATISLPVLLDVLSSTYSEEQATQAVDSAVQVRLLREAAPGSFEFAHDLVRQHVHAEIGPARRVWLHRRAGEAIEALPGVANRDVLLAYHFSEAAPSGQAKKAARYALLAAEHAFEQLAFEQAVPILERALAALDLDAATDHIVRADVFLALATAHKAGGNAPANRAACLEAAAHARAADARDRLAMAAIQGTAWGRPGVIDPAMADLCEEGLQALGETPTALRASLISALAFYRAVNESEGAVWADRSLSALRMARESGDVRAIAFSAFVRVWIIAATDRSQERLALAEELLALPSPPASGSHALKLLTYNSRILGLRCHAVACLELGDRCGFETDVGTLEALSSPGSQFIQGLTLMWRGSLALMDGRFTEFEERSLQMLEHRADDPNFSNSYAAQQFYLRLEQGRLHEFVPILEQALSTAGALQAFKPALALAHCQAGDSPAARNILTALADDGFATLPRDVTWLSAVSLAAEVCAAMREDAVAKQLYELLRPHAHHMMVVGWGACSPGSVDRYLGMLATTFGSFEIASRHFRSALALERRMSAPVPEARTCYWYGSSLRLQPSKSNKLADRLLGRSRRLAERLDLRGLQMELDAT
jgi:hypothetical protein